MNLTRTSTGFPTIRPSGSPRNSQVRRFGVLLFPLVFAEGALGVASVGERGSGTSVLLVAHVVLGTVLVALAAWAAVLSRRLPSRSARLASGFTAASLASTAITGALFLATGFVQGLVIDQGLALASLAGCMLMIVWGTARSAAGA